MRRVRRLPIEERAEVPMSPLIDCVFLLLIFFLATTMIKRKESLIPIKLPDQSSTVSSEASDPTIIIGLDQQGQLSKVSESRGWGGERLYIPIPDLAAYLKELVDQEGAQVLHRPLRIDADRETPFQIAVRTIDVCKLQGFTDVGIKTRGRKQ